MNIFKNFLIFIFVFSLDSHIYTMKNENNGSKNQDLESGINLYEWLEEEEPQLLEWEEEPQLYVDEKSNALLKECNKKKPSFETVKKLLLDKADVNKKLSETDQTPLHLVCQESPRSIAVIKALIDFKADVNAQDYLKESPLYELCKKKGCFESINLLIKNKADVNIKNFKGDTLFHISCKNPQINLINLFIENGVGLNNQGRWNNTPLHVVCNKKNPSIKIVKTLLENKANLNIQGKQKNTPLHLVCKQVFPSLEIIKILIQNGANPNCINKDGISPLFGVCKEKNPSLDAIKTLIEYKADPNIAYEGGLRLLHSICYSTNLSSELIQLLIEYKADPQIRDEYGNTPFHLICRRNDISFIIAFISSIINMRCENLTQVVTHLCKINPRLKTKMLSYLCCLKQQQLRDPRLKVPKVINFEIFKWMILALLDAFINIKNSENQAPLMFAQVTLGQYSSAVFFLNGLQEAIAQGYEAVIQFLRKAAELHKK